MHFMKKKWYKTWWGIIALVFVWPIFLLIWLSRIIWKKNWKTQYRIVALIGLWGFFLAPGWIISIQDPNTSSTYRSTSTNTSSTVMQATSAPTNTPKPVRKYKIAVTNQIVKKVNGKYRYFFDIRNHDFEPFEGDVSITLFTDELKNALAGDTFSTNQPIEPDLGSSEYIDANTGPVSVHGGSGITKFKYVVKKDENVVGSGDGIITDKFEDVDAYQF